MSSLIDEQSSVGSDSATTRRSKRKQFIPEWSVQCQRRLAQADCDAYLPYRFRAYSVYPFHKRDLPANKPMLLAAMLALCNIAGYLLFATGYLFIHIPKIVIITLLSLHRHGVNSDA